MFFSTIFAFRLENNRRYVKAGRSVSRFVTKYNDGTDFTYEDGFLKVDNRNVLDINRSTGFVISYPKHGGPNQKFEFDEKSGGRFKILNKERGVTCFQNVMLTLRLMACRTSIAQEFKKVYEDPKKKVEPVKEPVKEPEPIEEPEPETIEEPVNEPTEESKHDFSPVPENPQKHVINPNTVPIHRVINNSTEDLSQTNLTHAQTTKENENDSSNVFNQPENTSFNPSSANLSSKNDRAKIENCIDEICKIKQKQAEEQKKVEEKQDYQQFDKVIIIKLNQTIF